MAPQAEVDERLLLKSRDLKSKTARGNPCILCKFAVIEAAWLRGRHTIASAVKKVKHIRGTANYAG
jgi:hypothetical protein